MTQDTLINEPVKVWAFFDPLGAPSKVFPIAMNWRRQFVKFEKLVFFSRRQSGANRSVVLVCASKTSNYELEMESENFSWKLRRVFSE